MMVMFNSLERVVIFVLSGVVSLMLFDMIVSLAALRDRFGGAEIKAFSGRLSSALMIFLLGWKLAPGLMQFGQVLARPVLLLYAPGGLPGAALGAVLAAAYLLPLLPGGRRDWDGIKAVGWRKILPAAVLATVLFMVVWFTASRAYDWYGASRLNPAFLAPGA
jgi:hypothetical protein